ncbi:MAG: threonine synthase [Candidatus Aminicenantes bacterium]|nr:threonine synthase [Candidatus Aminicenantes bacterium]
MERLECLFCRKKHPLDVFNPFCPQCGEPMVLSYSPRKRTIAHERVLSLEKFQNFLPLASVNRRLSLGEGNTPLVPLHRVREKYGLPAVLAKNETSNPTHSFKDRGTAVAVQKAVAMGIKKIGTVSTGNMAASTAAYGAKAGIKTLVFFKEDSPPAKILSTRVYGAQIIQERGDYGKLFWKSFEIGRKRGIYFMNSVDPLRLEGYKVTAYEIFLDLERRAPRFVFVPVSSGGHLVGLLRGFLDLREEGLIAELPVFVGVQASGCSPLSRAFSTGMQRFKRIGKARTIAHAISNPDPPAGNLVLKLVRETSGMVVDVTDREILDAQRDLARLEGIFADPASATTLAALIKMSGNPDRKTRLRGDIVLIITGSGLKALNSGKG